MQKQHGRSIEMRAPAGRKHEKPSRCKFTLYISIDTLSAANLLHLSMIGCKGYFLNDTKPPFKNFSEYLSIIVCNFKCFESIRAHALRTAHRYRDSILAHLCALSSSARSSAAGSSCCCCCSLIVLQILLQLCR